MVYRIHDEINVDFDVKEKYLIDLAINIINFMSWIQVSIFSI